jgi:hypothetical protein
MTTWISVRRQSPNQRLEEAPGEPTRCICSSLARRPFAEAFGVAMKTVSLVGISDPGEARKALSRVLPCHQETWLLLAKEGDSVAYFYVDLSAEESDTPCIRADISGRHYNEDAAVIVLSEIAGVVGGRILTEE